MTLSLCITNFNRYDLLKESYAQVIDDPRISEIIIVDDCSTEPGIKEKVNSLGGGKVKVFHQVQNRGMSINKRDAIAFASNTWVIIFDSDNIIGPDYLDAFYNQIERDGNNHEGCIYMPDFAKPEFSFKKYAGRTYGAMSRPPVHEPMGNVMMNCCNFIVNKNEYLRIYKHNPEHICSDTIWFNYLWLKAGNIFYVVPGMEYMHRVHPGSGFMQDANYNMAQSQKVRKMIMAL